MKNVKTIAYIAVGVLLYISTAAAADCIRPNPVRGHVPDSIYEYYEVLEDGGFEAGSTELRTESPHSGIPTTATIQRLNAAARSGSWGYSLQAGPGQNGELTVKARVDKADDVHYSFWVKSLSGPTQVRPMLIYENDLNLLVGPVIGTAVAVADEWTKVTLVNAETTGFSFIYFGLLVEENTSLYVDDFSVQVPIWKAAEPEGATAEVGGITVPAVPKAPVYFAYAIHLEDPQELVSDEAFFRRKTAVFERLAEVFHNHGGRLTIQPELEWAQGAQTFAPMTLRRLSDLYGVRYSTHTHGPVCKDPSGKPYGAEFCSSKPTWDRNISEDDVFTYVQERKTVFESMSGTSVTDHNGNFDIPDKDGFADIGMQTLSIFKNKYTQRTFDYFIGNPWQPGNANALQDINTFLTHDPDRSMIYVPGVGANITKQHNLVELKTARVLSNFIAEADPSKVNACNLILHVDAFYSHQGTTENEYLSFNATSGTMSYSAEFEQHLQYWDDMLTNVVDPLVAGGYVEWKSIPEIGDAFKTWEAAQCPEPEAVYTHVPSEAGGETGIAVEIIPPAASRYGTRGAPIAVGIKGGFSADGMGLYLGNSFNEGFIEITFNFPGGGLGAEQSGGDYDNRGPNALKALRDVIKFAQGTIPDGDGHSLSDLISPIVPMYDNVGLVGMSNGGVASLTVAGLHGVEIEDLAWIVNWESPVGDGMPTAEAGSNNSDTNPIYNAAYNPDTGEWDMSALKYSEAVQAAGPPSIPTQYYGGFYFDHNGNNTPDEGTDFILYPIAHETDAGVKVYYSERVTKAALDSGVYPDPKPSHIAYLNETQDFWYYRRGDIWADEVVQQHPNLLFTVVAFEQDHVQSALDHPHVLLQYEAMGAAGVKRRRINADRDYKELVYGKPLTAPTDNPAGVEYDHTGIRTTVEPSGLGSFPIAFGVTAAMCENADLAFTGNYEAQAVPLSAARDAVSGWWVFPDEAGTGLSLERQQNALYIVWYVFDAAGNPIWYSCWAEKQGPAYSGDLRLFGKTGEAVSQESAGTLELVFTDEETAQIAWNAGAGDKAGQITKYMSGTQDLRNLDGWYIMPEEPATGVFLEIRGDTLFAGWFLYDEAGTPIWRVLGGWKDAAGFPPSTESYTQPWWSMSGGAPLNGPYTPIQNQTREADAAWTLDTTGHIPVITMRHADTDITLYRYGFSSGDPF